VCAYVHPWVRLCICLCFYASIGSCNCVSVRSWVCAFMCLCVSWFVCPCIHLSMSLCVFVSMGSCICVYMHLLIHGFVYSCPWISMFVHLCVSVSMCEWVCGCVCVCLCVCVCAFKPIKLWHDTKVLFQCRKRMPKINMCLTQTVGPYLMWPQQAQAQVHPEVQASIQA